MEWNHAYVKNVVERFWIDHADMKSIKGEACRQDMKQYNRACKTCSNNDEIWNSSTDANTSGRLPVQRERIDATFLARQRIIKTTSKIRLNNAENCHVPSAVDFHIKIGDTVLVFREDESKWSSPHKDVGSNGKV